MQRFIQCSFQYKQREYLSSIFLSFFFFKHSRKRWSNFYKIYRRYKRKHIRIIKLKSPYNFHIHLARLFFPPRETREIFFFLSFFLSTNLRSSLPLTVDSFYSENVHLYTLEDHQQYHHNIPPLSRKKQLRSFEYRWSISFLFLRSIFLRNPQKKK